MCGIIGILGKQPAAPLLVEGLKRLAYRGYDSAGVATLVNGHIDRRRAELQEDVWNFGRHLYADRPRAFVDRLGDCWHAWRSQAPATVDV